MEIGQSTSATSEISIATIFKIIWHTAKTACLEYLVTWKKLIYKLAVQIISKNIH